MVFVFVTWVVTAQGPVWPEGGTICPGCGADGRQNMNLQQGGWERNDLTLAGVGCAEAAGKGVRTEREGALSGLGWAEWAVGRGLNGRRAAWGQHCGSFPFTSTNFLDFSSSPSSR